MSTIKIPKGWRRLRLGKRILYGDRFLSSRTNRWNTFKYERFSGLNKLTSGEVPFIRRNRQPKQKGK